MTTPILFLLGALALSALGGVIVWIGSRPRPERFGSTIDTFNRDLDALAPPGSPKRSTGRAGSAPARRQAPRQQLGPQRQPQPRTAKSQARGDGPTPNTAVRSRPRPGPRPKSQPNSPSDQGRN